MKAVKTEMGGEVFPGAEPGVELHEMHGLSRSFPPHFHDHYVIGLITGGRRRVHLRFPCGGEGEAGFSGVAEAGDFIMIHPFEIHACEDIGGSSLDWKSLRLSRESVLPILGRTEGSFPPILRDRKLRRLFELLCAAVKEGGNRERQRELLAAVLRGLPRKTNRCAGKRRNIPSPFPYILRWRSEVSGLLWMPPPGALGSTSLFCCAVFLRISALPPIAAGSPCAWSALSTCCGAGMRQWTWQRSWVLRIKAI